MPLEGNEVNVKPGPIIKAFRFSKRYFVTVLFPVVCFGLIYKDYQRTTLLKIRKSSEGLP